MSNERQLHSTVLSPCLNVLKHMHNHSIRLVPFPAKRQYVFKFKEIYTFCYSRGEISIKMSASVYQMSVKISYN